jgi:hypothetical protein
MSDATNNTHTSQPKPNQPQGAPGNGHSVNAKTGSELAKMGKAIASEIPAEVKDLGHQATDLVTSQVRQTQEKTAGDLKAVASALRQTSKDLEGNVASPYVDKAADQIDRVSRFVRTTNLNDMKTTVESFARREPLLFVGGAFMLGIVAARFMKSSAPTAGAASQTPGSQANGQAATRSVGP